MSLGNEMRGMGLALLVGVAASGCGDEEVLPFVGTPVSVLDPTALTPVEAGRDPFSSHRPAVVDCPPATWGAEGGGFEIQTGACTYAAFDQPLPMAVAPGDALSFSVWHDRLDAAVPAVAHLAVWLGSRVLWETEVAIPAPSASFDVTVPIDEAVPPEARLGLHLHNHGFNSWRWVSVEVLPGGALE